MQKNPGVRLTLVTPDGSIFYTVTGCVPRIGDRLTCRSAHDAYTVMAVTHEVRMYPIDATDDSDDLEERLQAELTDPSLLQNIVVSLAIENGNGQFLLMPS